MRGGKDKGGRKFKRTYKCQKQFSAAQQEVVFHDAEFSHEVSLLHHQPPQVLCGVSSDLAYDFLEGDAVEALGAGKF